jgi:hypothetical protein
MSRWLLWMPVAALTVATALFGLRVGVLTSNLSETDMINQAAERYLAGGQDRSLTDCSSAEREVWLTVTCVPKAGAPELYHASPLGQLSQVQSARTAPEA